ncbi:MAG: hypothetical protein ACI9W2_002929 [Gammaproteobacteria bacterium]|jgi:hypothetical protein
MVEVSSLVLILLAEAAGFFALATFVMVFLTIRGGAKDKKALKQLIANVNEREKAHKVDLQGFFKGLSEDIDTEVAVSCVLGAETQFYQTFLRMYRTRDLDLVAGLPEVMDALVAPYRSIAGDSKVALKAPATDDADGSTASHEADSKQEPAQEQGNSNIAQALSKDASPQAPAEPERTSVDTKARQATATQDIDKDHLKVALVQSAKKEDEEPALVAAEPDDIDDELELGFSSTSNELDDMLDAALGPAGDVFDDELEVARTPISVDLDGELEIALGEDLALDETLDAVPTGLPTDYALNLEDDISALTQDEPVKFATPPASDGQPAVRRVEELTDENTRLAQELEATRETLNNMVNENATAFETTREADGQGTHGRVFETVIDLDDLSDIEASLDVGLDIGTSDLSEDILPDDKASLAKAS